MGYSAAAAAFDTLNTFDNHGTDRSGNVWEYNGSRYFFERGRENSDGAITGTIFRFVGTDSAVRVGSFRINPDGTIARAPFGLRNCLTQRVAVPVLTSRERWLNACAHDGIAHNSMFVVFSPNNPWA